MNAPHGNRLAFRSRADSGAARIGAPLRGTLWIRSAQRNSLRRNDSA